MTHSPQQPASKHSPHWVARGVSILNGMFGDYLHHRQNELAIKMACYQHNHPLALTSASLQHAHPTPTRKVCVLVHGLACNESIWTFSDTGPTAAPVSYGTLLQAELGYTPFYLRYNTGLPIAKNGKALAHLLNDLLACYPADVEEIILLGHSMGGLVIRSACHHGTLHHQAWVSHVKRIFYLGTPHDGADLERFAHSATGVLRAIPHPLTQLVGDILNLRSQGVKDLRFGHPLAEDGDTAPKSPAEAQQRAVPWLASAQHYVLVGTLTADPRHPVSQLLGDALVRMPRKPGRSAAADDSNLPSSANIKLFPGVHHLGLAHDPMVYQQIKQWCSSSV